MYGTDFLIHCTKMKTLSLKDNYYTFPIRRKSLPWGINAHRTFMKFAHNTGQVVNEAIKYIMSEIRSIAVFRWPRWLRERKMFIARSHPSRFARPVHSQLFVNKHITFAKVI